MKVPKKAIVSLVLALGACAVLAVREAGACTTFCLRRGKDVVYGKNYDWRNGDGFLIVNKRGVRKAPVPPAGDRQARWVSKYGSVTFNQWGREFPSGGMNEAGLVVELMWLDETRYPASDGRRPGMGGLEWIQYQLDNFARVDDVVRQTAGLRVSSDAPLHYLVCERSGRCATVEFLDGKLVSHSGASLPVSALANHTYADSLRFAKGLDGEPPGGYGSLERFARASDMMERYDPRNGKAPVEYAFEVLDRVAQGAYTQWSIVYDLSNLKVHFKTRENRSRRSVDLRAFDFSCSTPVRMIDLAAAGTGDITKRFVPYSAERNRQLVRRSFATTPEFRNTPPDIVTAMADTPERTSCALHP